MTAHCSPLSIDRLRRKSTFNDAAAHSNSQTTQLQIRRKRRAKKEHSTLSTATADNVTPTTKSHSTSSPRTSKQRSEKFAQPIIRIRLPDLPQTKSPSRNK